MIVIFLVNLNWYLIKRDIKDMGAPVSWFYNHVQDFSSLNDLAISGDAATAQRAITLRFRLYLGVMVFVLAMAVLFLHGGS